MFKQLMRKITIRLYHLHSHLLPVLVWLVAVACMVVLFRHRTQRFEVLGIAQGQVLQIAATCTGRLETIPVELFNNITRGQTVAVVNTVLDNENIEAQLAVIAAEIERLKAEIISTNDIFISKAAERQADKISTTRGFDVDVESAGIQILQLKSQLETDRITAQYLALEVKIVQDLLKQDAIAQYELQKAESQYNALAKQIEQNEYLLNQAEQDMAGAQKRRDEFARHQPVHPSADNAIDVIRKAIGVQEEMMSEVMAKRQMLVLKSPVNGMVTQIQKGPGDTVLAGEPILIVAELQPSQIVAYVDENHVSGIKERMVVQLIKNGNRGQIAESQVVSMGAAIELLPQRLWRNPNLEQWGRPVLIKIPPGMNLLPNQTVGIRGLYLKWPLTGSGYNEPQD